jgi:hypothetical protein
MLTSHSPLDGAKRKEMLYGPWTLNGGAVLSKFVRFAEAPCKDCYVTAIQYTSRYDNGSEILTSDGIWMHHCVLSSFSRALSYTPLGPNILWAGGNERPTLRLNTRYKYGLDWPANFNFLLEYMSAIPQPVNVSLAITFEYLEKSQPEARDYRDSYLIWNSVGTPVYQNGSYNHSSWEWTVPASGVLLHGMGHMHNGGTRVDLYVNGKMVCSSLMHYNERPGYGNYNGGHGGHGGAGMAMGQHHDRMIRRGGGDVKKLEIRDGPHKHGAFGDKDISDPGHCTSFGRVEKGDRMFIRAYYNTTEYDVMSHKGKVEEQMGILRVFVGPD